MQMLAFTRSIVRYPFLFAFGRTYGVFFAAVWRRASGGVIPFLPLPSEGIAEDKNKWYKGIR